jgi:hypothetical protein
MYTWKVSYAVALDIYGHISAYLFELELDWLWVHGCDSIGDVVPDLERLILGSPREGDKQRIGVAVDDSGVPLRPRVDELLSLIISKTSLRQRD